MLSQFTHFVKLIFIVQVLKLLKYHLAVIVVIIDSGGEKKSSVDAKGSESDFDKEKNIRTVTKEKNRNFAVEKSDRHIIQLIKISNSNEN